MTGANKTVLITGSNRGIGLEFVRQYSDASFNVIATCRRQTEAENLQRLSKERENITSLQISLILTRILETCDITSRIQKQKYHF